MPPDRQNPEDPREWLRRARRERLQSPAGPAGSAGAAADVQEASALTDYAVSARYPGPSEPVLLEDYENAVATATLFLVWRSRIVEERFGA